MNPLEMLESFFLTAEHVVSKLGPLSALATVFYHLGLWVSPSGEGPLDNKESKCLICGYPVNPNAI